MYERYKDTKFKVGEDDDGYKIRMKFKYFLEYLVYQKDDNPMYLFESALEDIKDGRSIIDHFKIPKYFRDDLLSIV